MSLFPNIGLEYNNWTTQVKVILFHGFCSKSNNHFLHVKSIIKVLLLNTNNEILNTNNKAFLHLSAKAGFVRQTCS